MWPDAQPAGRWEAGECDELQDRETFSLLERVPCPPGPAAGLFQSVSPVQSRMTREEQPSLVTGAKTGPRGEDGGGPVSRPWGRREREPQSLGQRRGLAQGREGGRGQSRVREEEGQPKSLGQRREPAQGKEGGRVQSRVREGDGQPMSLPGGERGRRRGGNVGEGHGVFRGRGEEERGRGKVKTREMRGEEGERRGMIPRGEEEEEGGGKEGVILRGRVEEEGGVGDVILRGSLWQLQERLLGRWKERWGNSLDCLVQSSLVQSSQVKSGLI